jgi:hypothetical protein
MDKKKKKRLAVIPVTDVLRRPAIVVSRHERRTGSISCARMEPTVKIRIAILLTMILGLGALLPGFLAGPVSAAEDTGKTITYLLDYVSKSDLTFVRNGQDATGKQAAAHMRQKWDYFRPRIKTPEDFIRLAATKSELSGKLYLVRFKDGRESPAGEWLTKVLADYRKEKSL